MLLKQHCLMIESRSYFVFFFLQERISYICARDPPNWHPTYILEAIRVAWNYLFFHFSRFLPSILYIAFSCSFLQSFYDILNLVDVAIS